MGRAKSEQMDKQDRVSAAIAICIDFGAIEECEYHDGTYIDSMEFLDHRELADRILAEDPSVLERFRDKGDFYECVSEAMQSAGDECGSCAKNRDS